MRFMALMIPGDKSFETGKMPDETLVAAMMKYNEDLAKAGVLLALDGLHPTSKGARISFSGGKTAVKDGPFTEAKEIVGGFYYLKNVDRDQALAIAENCPAAEWCSIELREVGPCNES